MPAGLMERTRKPYSIAVALLLAVGCMKHPEKAIGKKAASVTAVAVSGEAGNLLTLASGAVVLERSGENNLSTTPLQAIDSSRSTAWSSPPNDFEQSASFAFPAPTRIDHLGLWPLENSKTTSVKRFRIESSRDGKAFEPWATLDAPGGADRRVAIEPRELMALRFTVLELEKDAGSFSIAALTAYGQRVSPLVPADVSGSWRINEQPAIVQQTGRHFEGIVDGSVPTSFRGSISGNVGRFTWNRSNEAGFGVLTVDAAAQHLDAVVWHEKPIDLFSASSWLGTKSGAQSRFDPPAMFEQVAIFLRVSQRFPSFDVHFDDRGAIEGADSLEALGALRDFAGQNPEFKFRLNAQYFGASSREMNRKVTDARIGSIRAALSSNGGIPKNLELTSIGGEVDVDPPANALDKPLYDRVELQVTGAAAP